MTSATPTRFRFAALLRNRSVAWSRPSSGHQPSRTKGVTLLGRFLGVVFMQLFKLSILSSCKTSRCDFLATKCRLPHDFTRLDSQTVPYATRWRRAGVVHFFTRRCVHQLALFVHVELPIFRTHGDKG